MAAEKALALVLRLVEFSESSLVLTLFTREFGKVRGLAKGARRLKGPFESALDLLAVCRIVFLRKSSEALDLLTEAKLVRWFRPAGRDLASLYAGYYVAEFVDALTDDYDPHPELFDLADETLAALAAGELVARRLLRFELEALRLLGHLPALDACVQCGVEVRPADRMAFGQLEGGLLCPRCRQQRRQVAVISRAALAAMAALAEPDGVAWRSLELDRRTHGEIRGVLNRYLTNLLGKKPQLHEYLTSLSS